MAFLSDGRWQVPLEVRDDGLTYLSADCPPFTMPLCS